MPDRSRRAPGSARTGAPPGSAERAEVAAADAAPPAKAAGLRRAGPADLPRITAIRAAVRENRLTDPAAVTEADLDWFIGGGRTWVAEEAGEVMGFSAADTLDGSVWALFVAPGAEGRGLGRALLAAALGDLAAAGHGEARLSTDPGTRAERLYRALGWHETGRLANGEVALARRLG